MIQLEKLVTVQQQKGSAVKCLPIVLDIVDCKNHDNSTGSKMKDFFEFMEVMGRIIVELIEEALSKK